MRSSCSPAVGAPEYATLAAAGAAGDGRLKRRLVYQCRTFGYCIDPSTTPGCKKGVLDQAAAFLIGAGDDHYFASGGWGPVLGDNGNFSTHWFPGLFDQPLGEPISDGAFNRATQVWTRSFKSGTKVTFNALTKKGAIDWSS